MEILMLNLGIVYVCSLFATMNFRRGTFETDSKNYNTLFIVFALISLIVVSGFRYKVGTDYAQYSEIYTVFAPDCNPLEESEPGFMVLCKFLTNFSMDPQIMFLVTSIITNILIVITVKKYSTKFELSMFLYITTFIYYSTMNGLRQWMASAIVFAGYKYLINRDFKRYMIFVLIALTMHSSAIVMIPVYFVVNNDTFSKKNLLIVIGFVAATFFYEKFADILFGVIGNTSYGHYEEVMAPGGNGVNPLRFAVYLAPLLVSLKYHNKINPTKDRKIDIMINLCVLDTLIWMLAMNNIFFARLTFYFDLYFLFLIPMIVSMDTKSFNRLAYYTVACGYFVFSYMLLVTGDSWIIPYTFNITLF